MALARARRAGVAGLLVASGMLTAAAYATPETDLADRLAALASTFNGRIAPDDADVRAALYNAAVELDPADGRLLRLKLDAAGRAADTDAALAALTALRKLEPTNTYFQAKQIELYLGRLETADAKLKYLTDIVAAESVAGDVRSFAATRAARLYWEQNRSRPAWEMIRKALSLNNINAEAQRLQWIASSQSATGLQRVQLLLSMLRANPGQVDAAAMLAEELSTAGLLKPAADWFDYALTLSKQAGLLLPRRLASDYASVLYLSGRQPEGGEWLQRVLKADPTDPSSLFLLMAAVEAKQPQLIAAVQEGLEQRIKMVRAAAAEPSTQPATAPEGPATAPSSALGPSPATAPLATAAPEMAAATTPAGGAGADAASATTQASSSGRVAGGELDADVAMFKDNPRQMRGAYVSALSDLAWFHLYFRNDAASAQSLIEALRKLLPSDDTLLARLDGWTFLSQGKLAEANVKLSAGAGRDALCELGVIDILKREPARREAARTRAKKLLEQHPCGTLGVILQRRLADLAVKPDTSAAAEAIRDAVDRFPMHLRRLVTAPQEFYSIRAEIAQVEHEFSQPIMLTVTIRNISDQPLTMGENGIIRDVWFDAQLRGGVDRFLPGVAMAPLTGPLVLAPRASYTQQVRLDAGLLAQILEVVPSTPVQISVGVVLNAVPGETGIAPGIYGYRSRMDQMAVRKGMPLWTETQVQLALSALEGGDPASRIRIIDAVSAHLALTPENSPQAITPALRDAWKLLLDKGTRDTSPIVQTWALYCRASLGAGGAGSLDQLVGSASVPARLLAALAARNAPAAAREAALRKLSEDPDAGVRQVAKAIAAMPVQEPMSPATATSGPLLREMDIRE